MPNKFPVRLDQLHFDPHNPRFITSFGDDETKMFRYLVTDIGVDDLLQSISASGFIDGDPIIVRDRPEGDYFVVEGNRRLAALKLLTGESPKDDKPNPAVPEISGDEVARLKTVSVQSGWTDELLRAYLGYKHVTAAREWPPEAKAKFVFEHAGGNLSKENLTKFAKTLGTNFATLKRWLIAFFTLKQAEDNGLFDPAKVTTKRYFGTFYTLLGGQQAKEFLSLKEDDPLVETPVPGGRIKELGEFVSWTIGDSDMPASVNSRQQAEFERVLASPSALQHFRVKRDLDASLLYTEYNADEVADKLKVATYVVEGCLSKLYDVRENPNVKDAFVSFELAYKKARLNMQSDSPSLPEEK